VPITVITRSLHRISYLTGPFGAPPDASSVATTVSARELTAVDEVWYGYVTATARPVGETVGGWSFAQHHRYDPVDGTLYLGDGTERSADQVDRNSALWRLTGAGNGDVGDRSLLTSPEAAAVAIGPDGTVYLAEPARHRVVAVGPDGDLVPVAGTGIAGDTGDGGAAVSATLVEPAALAVDRDGSLLVADRGAARVRRIATDGTIVAFAGTGEAGSNGDGGPATDAELIEPASLAVVADGTVLVADHGAGTVRSVSPDGTIRTYAGGGVQTDCPVGCTRDSLDLTGVSDVAVAADGERLAVAAGGVVHEVDTGGLFRTISSGLPISVDQIAYDGAAVWMGGIGGYLRRGSSGELTSPNVDSDGSGGTAIGALGGMAAGSRVDVADLAVTPDGEVVIADSWADGAGGDGEEGEGGETSGSVGYDGVLVLSGPLSFAGSSLPPHGPQPGSGPLAQGAATLLPSDDGSRIFLFGPSGRHLRTVLSDTLVVEWSFGYDDAGALVAVSDSVGRTTAIERSAGSPTAVVGPFGHRTTLGLADGLITSSAGPENQQRTFGYANGQLIEHTDEAGNPASYAYGADGRLTASVAADGTTYSLTHTELPDGRETVLVTGGIDVRTTRSTTNEFSGTYQVSTTLPDGSQHDHFTNADGSVSVSERDNDTVVVFVQSDPRFGPSAILPLALSAGRGDGFVSDSTFTSYGVQAELDALDEPLSLTGVERTSVESAGETTTVRVDPAARSVVSTDPTGVVTTLAYDERGLTTDVGDDSGSASTEMTYDANGLLTARTTGERTTSYVNGPDGLPDSVTVPGGEQRTMDFDAAGRLVSMTDDGGATMTHTYDALGHMTGWTSPEGVARTGTLTAKGRPLTLLGPPDPVVGRTYDAARHPTGVQHGDGTSTVITTADGGKPIAVDGPEVDLGITYGFLGSTATPANVQSATWQAPGVLVTTFPDQRGSLLAGTEWVYNNGTVHQDRSDVRWSDGLVVQRRVNSANSSRIDFGYDAADRMTAAGPYAIDRTGPSRSPSSISRGTSSLELDIDPYGSLSSRALRVGADVVASTDLEHDANGRVTRQTVTVEGDTLFDESYRRNERGFVTQVRNADDEVVESASYDLDGNRTELNRDGDTVESLYRPDGVIDSHDGDPITVDANGMVTGVRGISLDHAVSGELLTATVDGQVVRYGYDFRGRRVARDVGGQVTSYLYGDPTNPGRVTDTVAPNGTVTQYLYDDAGMVFAVRVGGTWYTVVTDAVGSPVAVVDAAGVVVDQRRWSMWGEELSDSAPGFELEIGYAGGLQDPLTGLVRFGVREYDPVTARWLSPDPFGLGGGASNLYRYAENDPVSWRDPSGAASVSAGFFRGPGAAGELHSTPEGMAFCVEIGAGVSGGVEFNTADESLPAEDDSQQAEVGFGPFTFKLPLTPGFKEPCSIDGIDLGSQDPFSVLEDVFDAKTRGEKVKAAIGGKVTQKWCFRF
jgi:RHS repeat-associated protein